MRAQAAHLKIVIQINSCLPEQLLPGNWITDEENSLLPGNFGIGPSFFFERAPVLFYSNPQGRYSTLTHRAGMDVAANFVQIVSPL